MIEIIYLSFIIIVNNFQLIKSYSLHDQRLARRQLQAQNCEVAPGINYEYVYVKGNNGSKGTILFLHGFPSSYNSWRHQIEYFSNEGYDCLAPNMMGYGKTYSPVDIKEYKMKSMVEHLITLLNKFQIDKVIVIGHDWGTRVAGRFVLHHPERTLGVTLISGA
jgi:pimeloyl-ACP methyl ester carboxylesterase